jgi:uncharacterized repeat protein (TIGR01451 family)
MKTQRTNRFQAVRRLSTMLLFGATLTLMIALPFGIQTATAAPTDTGAGITISNTAQIGYSVSGVNQTPVPSTTAQFVVDHKVRPVVTSLDAANVPVVAGSADQYLTFQVLNDGNTAGTTDFDLSSVASGALAMTSVLYYEESGVTPGFQAAEDGPAVATISLARDTSATVYLVGTTPGGATVGQTGTYDLIATSTLPEAGSDNPLASDAVYADGAGSIAADIAFDGRHSDGGVFEVVTVALTATKSSAVVNDYVNAAPPYFAIPGALVRYTLVVTNTSAVLPTTAVTISDTIPANTTYVADSVTIGGTGYVDGSPQVTYAAGTLTVNAGNLAAGAAVTVTFDVTIN